jgi:predicted ABC-type ATPase
MLRAVMSKVVVIAGPNGAGKSTAAPAVLRNALRVNEFVNADTIAAGLSAFSPEAVAHKLLWYLQSICRLLVDGQ